MFVYICIRKNAFFIPFYLWTAHIEDFHHNTTQSKCNLHTHLLQTQLQTTIDRQLKALDLKLKTYLKLDRQSLFFCIFYFSLLYFNFCFLFRATDYFWRLKHSVMKICSYNNEIFKHFQWIEQAKHCHCICSDGALSADWSHW